MTRFTAVALIIATLVGGSPLALAQTTPAPQPLESSVAGPEQRAMTMGEQEARDAFARAGYTSIGDVKPDEDGYSATAVKDGKAVKIGVDLDGTVETLN